VSTRPTGTFALGSQLGRPPPTGDGGLSWTPSGSTSIVIWGFDVEIG